MNFRIRTLMKITGLFLIISGLAMIPSFLCALWFGEETENAIFGTVGFFSAAAGIPMLKAISPSKKSVRARDGYLTVVFCLLVCTFIGTLPYLLSGQVSGFADALFESTAGYTTTGATISSIGFSHSLLLWKATTHWLGGLGILVFIISVLPSFGSNGQRIANIEMQGFGLAKMSLQIWKLSKITGIVYAILTAVTFFFLRVGNSMGNFAALLSSMDIVSTAGMSLRDNDIGYYNSLYIELIVSLFTILASINFILYIYIIKRNYSDLQKNVELRVYLIIIAAATLIVSTALKASGTFSTFASALRHGFFQVTSFATTSGFTIDDYSRWPAVCLAVFFILMFIGGCSASTAGSIKVIRVIVFFKLIARGFYKRLHPRSIRTITVGEAIISAPMVSTVATFVMIYFVTFMLSALVISLQGLDMETTLSAAASLLSNSGIVFGDIGSSGYYGMFSPAMKVFMSLVMVTGRLELYSIFLLFFPSFWNPDRSQIK